MRLFIPVVLVFLVSVASNGLAIPLTNALNKHNLSSTSSNAVRAQTETRICVFCHTPHGGSSSSQSALWNRKDPSTTNFPLYSSGTLNIDDAGIVGDSLYDNSDPATYPNGATRMCLSCHDGVSAIGEVLSGSAITMLASMPASGIIDLATSHPVSFVYNATVKSAINAAEGVADDVNYVLPSIVPLDGQERMQCTTCHDPHTDTWVDVTYELPFWRNYTGTDGDVLDYDNTCGDCHKGNDWGGSWGGTPTLPHALP